MYKEIKDFDFYSFFKDISNQSLDPLQDNSNYDDLVRGMENVFNKLYRRVQEISILNTLDLNSDRNFNKNINGNENTSLVESSPYKDLILEQLSLYLDTDHFTNTVAKLIRLWQKREIDSGLIGNNEENLDSFIESFIIPSFIFFTKNAGDLHKSKGVKILLKRLFDFYGQVSDNEINFDDVEEHEDQDEAGRRFNKFTSLREGITLNSLLKNYEEVEIFSNINLKITNYIELQTHRFAVADGYLFISRKDREDWHIINIVDDVYKLNDYFLVIRQFKNLYVYDDRINLYDTESLEFISPEVRSDITVVNAEFVPKIINIEDKFKQYHTNNLYFVEKNLKPTGGFGCFQYNLKRIRYREEYDTLAIETLKLDIGITWLDLLYLPLNIYPRVINIKSMDYLWLNFYDADTTNTFEFYPNPLIPDTIKNVKFVYSFIIEEQTKTIDPNDPSGFLYPVGEYVCVSRDGYNYNNEDNGFAYSVLGYIPSGLGSKYILQERNVSNILESELNKIIGNNIEEETIVDVFIPKENQTYKNDIYTKQGTWNADNLERSTPALSPNDGDYWTVSNDGNIELNGIKYWQYGDVVVWNARLGEWEKNNEVEVIAAGNTIEYTIDHRLLVIAKEEFLNSENEITSPYEKNCGLFEIQLSSFILNIQNFSKLFWVDTNAIEKFTIDPNVIFSYIDKTTKKYIIHSVQMNGFYTEHNRIDISRVTKNFPVLSSGPIIYKIEMTDKYLLLYCEKFTREEDSKSEVIICEDTMYNFNLGIRNNKINVSYNADVRLKTRERQPYFKEWNTVNGVNVIIDGEEVSAFKNTLERYSTINSKNEFIQERINIGISSQIIGEDESTIESVDIEIDNYGTKKMNEISKLNSREYVQLRIEGNPEEPNCDCNLQRSILYLSNFTPMTIFYNFETEEINSGISKLPTCLLSQKIGKVNNRYSSFEDACQFDTDWFYYEYNDGISTIPRLIRSRFRINLFDKIQKVSVDGAGDLLEFNWSVHCLAEAYEDNPYTTIAEWLTLLDEEIFMPIKINSECNPIGTYYTSNNTVPPNTIVSAWDIYNISAMNVNTVYNCTYTPWTPTFSDYTRYSSDYPEILISSEIQPVRV
jgi:hypothetical protein